MAILRRTPWETGILNPDANNAMNYQGITNWDTSKLSPEKEKMLEDQIAFAKSWTLRHNDPVNSQIDPVISAALSSSANTMPLPASTFGTMPKKEIVNLGGQQPVRNPYTNGFETVNPAIQANTGMYSPEQKAQAVKDLGYTLKPGQENVGFDAIRDAFFRKEGGIGVKEEMLAPYFTKGNAAQEIMDNAQKGIESQKQSDQRAMEEGKLLTGQQQQTQPGWFAEFSSGISSQAGQFFKDTGIAKQISALETEKKRMESMLADGTLSQAERDRIKWVYDSANVALQVAKDANVRQLQIGQWQSSNEYDVAIQRQIDTNNRLLENSQKMAALTGASFSTGWMTGLGSVLQQGQAQVNDIFTKKAGMMMTYQNKLDEVVGKYQADVMKNDAEMKKAIADKYSDTQAAINKIDAEIGKTTNEGIKQLREVAKDYLDFIDKEARRTMEKEKFAFDKVKFDTEQTYKEEKDQRDYYKGIFDSAFKEGNLYGIPVSQIDSLDMPEEMKTMLKGGIVRDTINAMNELGESAGMTDLGTRYAEIIRSGIAKGFSSADLVASLSDQLNIPLTKPKETDSKTTVHNLGDGKYLVQNGDKIEEFDAKKKVQTIGKSGILSSLGNGKVTGRWGPHDGWKGLDVDWNVWDPIMGFSGKIVSVIDANNQSSPFGNSVVIEDADGNQIRISHLDSLNVQPGQSISATDLIGTLGNTWYVTWMNGEKLTAEQLAAGRGSHLDIRVRKAWAKDEMSWTQVEQFLGSYGKWATTQDGGIIGAGGIPIMYKNTFMKYIPAAQKKDENEQKRLLEDATALHDSGIPADEAALMAIGVTIPKGYEQEFKKFMNIGASVGDELPANFYSTLQSHIEQNGIESATAYVEGIVDDKVKKREGDKYISTGQAKFLDTTLEKIESMIARNKDKIGPLSARFANLENKLSGDPDYQSLKTLLTGSVAGVRHELAGSAVTDSELNALRDLVEFDTKLPIESLLAKIRTHRSQKVSEYESQRSFLGGNKSMLLGTPQKTVSDSDISAFLSGQSSAGWTSGFINPFE